MEYLCSEIRIFGCGFLVCNAKAKANSFYSNSHRLFWFFWLFVQNFKSRVFYVAVCGHAFIVIQII